MKRNEKTATEIIQRISSDEAWEYRIVPFKEEEAFLFCYGDDAVDWDAVIPEIEVVTGERIRIVPAGASFMSMLLNQYYRRGEKRSRAGQLTAGGDRFLANIIEEAFRTYASDIHFECYEERCRVRFRIDGKLIEHYVIDRQNYPAIINQVKILASLDISEKRLPQDGRIFHQSEGDKFDVRVSCLPTIYGEKVVLRLLTRHVELLELSNLGFSDKQLADYTRAVQKPHGLVLISGPTGSGKSTTLYATLRMLNKETGNILTGVPNFTRTKS